MKCSKVRKMLSQYVDGELSPDDRRFFEFHIDGCPFCKRELEEHMAVHNLFVSIPRLEAPAGLAMRVMTRLEGAEETNLSRWWRVFTGRPFLLRTVEVAFAMVIMLIGMISGGLLVAGKTPTRQISVGETFSLNVFQVMPPNSIGGIYVKLSGVTGER